MVEGSGACSESLNDRKVMTSNGEELSELVLQFWVPHRPLLMLSGTGMCSLMLLKQKLFTDEGDCTAAETSDPF